MRYRLLSFDGQEYAVKTNFGDMPHSMWDGYDVPKKYKSCISESFGESYADFMKRLCKAGYTEIRFVNTTTNVRGYHKLYAFVR